MSPKSGLGERARGNNPDKYTESLFSSTTSPPNEDKPVEPEPIDKKSPGSPTESPALTKAPFVLKETPRANAREGHVANTWHLPLDLVERFENFVSISCPRGTKKVAVIRQILDDFLSAQGF